MTVTNKKYIDDAAKLNLNIEGLTNAAAQILIKMELAKIKALKVLAAQPTQPVTVVELPQTPTFKGDDVYTQQVYSVGRGDNIAFERAVFSGNSRAAHFEGFELIKGVVKKESYGEKTGQHTFTIMCENGNQILIKGRNLYKNGVWISPPADLFARSEVLAEKHARGDVIRAAKGKTRELF